MININDIDFNNKLPEKTAWRNALHLATSCVVGSMTKSAHECTELYVKRYL